jgi:ankyrin repeat protein
MRKGSYFLASGLFVAGLMVGELHAAAAMDMQLADAVRRGDRDAVRQLIKSDPAAVNRAAGDGSTALLWSAFRNDNESASLLLAAGANPNAANDYGVTSLSLACTNRNDALVEMLLKAKANPNVAESNGVTPLMTCAHAGALVGVKALLAAGAKVDAADTDREQTALMRAAAQKHADVVKALLAAKADVNLRSKRVPLYTPMRAITYSKKAYFPEAKGQFNALMFAAQSGDVDTGKTLLDAGAKVDDGTEFDGTPLVLAAQNGNEKFAIMLLDRGANPNARDGYGLTAMHWALQEGLAEIFGGGKSLTDKYWVRPNSPELVKALLTKGADPNSEMTKDFMPYEVHRFARSMGNNLPQLYLSGITPFLLATASGDVGMMRYLVERRADPKIATGQGTTPVMVAAGIGREREPRTPEERQRFFEALKLTVALGGDINAKDQNGRTALHGAVYLGDLEMIEFLVKNGADLEAKDKYGQTAITIAMGDPGGLVYRQLPGDAFDYSFRQPARDNQKATDLLLKLGAKPYTGPIRDRSAE